jgi:hypothetical protein
LFEETLCFIVGDMQTTIFPGAAFTSSFIFKDFLGALVGLAQ